MGNAKLSDLMEFRKLFSMWFFSHSLLWLSIRVEQRRWKTIDNWLRWTFVVIQRKKKKKIIQQERRVLDLICLQSTIYLRLFPRRIGNLCWVCVERLAIISRAKLCVAAVFCRREFKLISLSLAAWCNHHHLGQSCATLHSSNEILWCECTKCSANIKLTTKSLKLQQLKLRIASLTLWANIA